MILIRVEATCNGGFRLTTPDGCREYVRGYRWRIEQRKEALDLFEHVYQYPRKQIRFDVR